MLKCEEVLATLVRPTGDSTTEPRTYKRFYDPNRARTENYPDARFQVIWQISSQVSSSVIEATSANFVREATSAEATFETKNIDSIAYEFCRVYKLLSSLDTFYNQIIYDFKNLLNLEVEYFVNPDDSKEDGVIFKLLIKDKPKKIIQQENNFYQHIRKSVPTEERKYFSLVYSVV